jgi:hypothetical protein
VTLFRELVVPYAELELFMLRYVRCPLTSRRSPLVAALRHLVRAAQGAAR